MISFIVIGLNRYFFLQKCFESILFFVNESEINFEIIYLDSGSDEDNVKLSLSSGFKTIKLSGDINAAIARNVGADLAKGDYLIFMDGDMILNHSFAKKFLNKNYFKSNRYFSGDLLNRFYNNNYEFINEEFYWRKPLKEKKMESTTGGLFCITKDLWNSVDGMRNYYRRTQDNDFGLRLAKKNIFLQRNKELFVIHQTISYTNKYRLIKILFKGDFFFRGLLYRDHFFNKKSWDILVKTDYSLITLLISIILSIILINYKFIIIHLIVTIMRAVRAFIKNNENVFLYFLYILARDYQVFFGFLFFYPKKDKNYKFEILKNEI